MLTDANAAAVYCPEALADDILPPNTLCVSTSARIDRAELYVDNGGLSVRAKPSLFLT
jgi:hypothetical protein